MKSLLWQYYQKKNETIHKSRWTEGRKEEKEERSGKENEKKEEEEKKPPQLIDPTAVCTPVLFLLPLVSWGRHSPV